MQHVPHDIHARIDEAGERRRQALAMADSALNDVVDLVPEALDAGMTKQEIAQLTGVSRMTIDAVLSRRRDAAHLGDIHAVVARLSA